MNAVIIAANRRVIRRIISVTIFSLFGFMAWSGIEKFFNLIQRWSPALVGLIDDYGDGVIYRLIFLVFSW